MVIFNRYVKFLEGTSGPVVQNHVFVLNADVGTPDKKHLSFFGTKKWFRGLAYFGVLVYIHIFTYICIFVYKIDLYFYLISLYIYIYTFKFGVSTSSMFILFVTIGYKYIEQPF